MYKRLDEKQVVLGRLRVIYMHQRAKYIKQNGDYVRVSSLKPAKGGAGSQKKPIDPEDIEMEFEENPSSFADLPSKAHSMIAQKLILQSPKGLNASPYSDVISLASTSRSMKKAALEEIEDLVKSLNETKKSIPIPRFDKQDRTHTASILISRNGETIVSNYLKTNNHSIVALRNRDDLKRLTLLAPNGDIKEPYILAIHPDGNTLATIPNNTNQGTIQLWKQFDKHEWKKVRDIDTNAIQIRSMMFSPNGKMLAADGTINGRIHKLLIWDMERPLEPTIFPPEENGSMILSSYTFSEDSETIAYGTGNTLRIHRKNQNHRWEHVEIPAFHLDNPNSVVKQLAFNYDKSILAYTSGVDKTVRLWNMRDGSTAELNHGPRDTIKTIVFSPKRNLFITTLYGGTMILYHLYNGQWKKLIQYTKPNSVLMYSSIDIMFHPDGHVIRSVDNILRPPTPTQLKATWEITERNIEPLIQWLDRHR